MSYLKDFSNKELDNQVFQMCRDMKSCNNFVSTDFDRIDYVQEWHDDLKAEYKKRGLDFASAKRSAYSDLS